MKSREEIRFLALLAKTQEKAAKMRNHQITKTGIESSVDEVDSNSQTDLTGEEDWRLPKVKYFFNHGLFVFMSPDFKKMLIKGNFIRAYKRITLLNKYHIFIPVC